MTGIPCGNPKRYKSRAVIRMTRDEKVPYEDQQIGIPGTGTETEAEKEFKKLLDQQMNISNTYILPLSAPLKVLIHILVLEKRR